MKRIIYTFSLFLGLAILSIGFSGGPAASQNSDMTNSPVSNGACQNCHSDGSFNPQIDITVTKDGTPVTAYIPGETYIVRTEVTANNGTPSKYGTQMVALDDGNADAGAFGDAPAGYQKTPLNSRTYVEHSQALDANSLEIEWTAPAAGAGDVTFYAGGSAVNDNSATSGDNGAVNSLMLTEDMNSNTENPTGLNVQLQIAPNPVAEQMNVAITSKNNGNFTLRLTDTFGKVALEMPVELIAGENQQAINVSHLAKGMYILQLCGDEHLTAQQMIKL